MKAFDTPFRHWIIDDFAPETVLPRNLSVMALPWVEYHNDCEAKKRTCNDPAALGPDGAILRWLNTEEMALMLAELTGVPGLQPDPLLYGAGIHVTDPGGWLQVHADYEIHPTLPDMERRLSLVLPVHPEWRPEWGGELLLCDTMGKVVHRYLPLPNRALIFENGPVSLHGVRMTSSDALPRITAAAYFIGPMRHTVCRRRAMFLPNRASPDVPDEVK